MFFQFIDLLFSIIILIMLYFASILEFQTLNFQFWCLFRYYDQLHALEAKIPPTDVQIPFKWKDAFNKGSLFGGRVSLSKLIREFFF